ncbi:MAG: CxxxxCH/CxxCH domain-containing protein [Myxococcales bacterium]|nr:CxxxxCH/CxxCH domain-containing protein [Myxococcales bacterium]
MMFRAFVAIACMLGLGCVETTAPAGPGCAGCHGSEANAAPPSGLGGIDDRSTRSVGAHQEHLAPQRAVPVECDACHLVPEALNDEGHIDDGWPAEVKWADLSVTGGASTPFDVEGQTCTVYCHGTTTTGGEDPRPTWTAGPEAARCSSCHGNPPPAPHPADDQCLMCHTRDAATEHVDGVVQLRNPEGGEPCGGCHGEGPDDLWPPPDVSGNTETTTNGVGAHEAHRTGNGRAAPTACSNCHLIPLTVNDKGHRDPAPAEVVFAGVATMESATPVWNGGTCSETYCHTAGDAVVAGGAVPEPLWRAVDGTQVGCAACHGNPPPLPHPAVAACGQCHPNATADGSGFTLPLQHVDGTVDVVQ